MSGGARTALFNRQQPGGLFSIIDVVDHPGDVFFVDSTHANKSNSVGSGRGPDAPFATLDYAIGQCASGDGDVIYVMPGHAENITAADSINCDIAGVTIIGLGRGNNMPTFSATAAAGGVTIAAANVAICNVRLLSNFTGGATQAITVAAAGVGCSLVGIELRETVNTKEWLVGIGVATGVTDLLISKCSIVDLLGGSMTNAILFAGTSSDCVIEDCYIFVDSSDDVIDHLTAASVNLVVRRCVVVNADTGAAGYCLRYKSDGTGIAHDNRFAYNKVDAEVSVGAAAWWFQNYASNTIAESGLLDPTTAHLIP